MNRKPALDGVSELKVLWKEWNVPTLVITSLTLQLILILAGPLRIKTRNGVIVGSIWLAYLMADWVAAQAVGLISRNPDDLYALWAQFLLLHLGGPDSITALALEDNNLWLRMGLHLAVQGYTTLGVLVRSIRTSKLWVPMVLMFLAGNIKYMERVSALFSGRLTEFHEDPNLHIDGLLAGKEETEKEETEIERVRSAFYLFNHYKGVYADRQIMPITQQHSKSYFQSGIMTSEDAFKVLELQFYFTYEAIFTKARITQMRSWKILRPVVTLLSVGCLVIWCFSKKDDIESHHILITYSLLIGAIIVDILAIFRSQLSYWNIARYRKCSPMWEWVYNNMLVLYNSRSWGKYWRKEEAPIWERLRRAFFRRWSESISQLNLLELVREKEEITWLERVADFFNLSNALTAFKFETGKWFPDHMRDFIVQDLKCKSLWVGDDNSKASNICHAKGSYACKRLLTSTNAVERWKNVLALLDDSKEYKSIFVHWHIITELCYCDETQISGGGGGVEEQDRVEIYREISKTLSDYVMYLLLQQPVMMASVVSGDAKDMMKDLSGRLWGSYSSYNGSEQSNEARNRTARENFRDVISRGKINTTPSPPDSPTGSWTEFPYSLHPVMEDLEALEAEKGRESKWKFMAEVWAELLYYAAIRCKPSVHAAQLKQGGELISFIWLLMLQIGFGLQESEPGALKYRVHAEANYLVLVPNDWRPPRSEFQSTEHSMDS